MSPKPVQEDLPGEQQQAPPAPSGSRAEQVLQLFLSQHGRLVSFLRAKVGSRSDAEDLAQRAYEKLLTVEKQGTVSFLSHYLYTTAANLAIDRQRQQATRRRAEALASHDVPHVSPSLEPIWIARERVALLGQAMQQLPAKIRMAFRLRVFEDATYEEIVTRMSAEGVKIDLRTAKRYVARALENCAQFIAAAEQAGGGPDDDQ